MMPRLVVQHFDKMDLMAGDVIQLHIRVKDVSNNREFFKNNRISITTTPAGKVKAELRYRVARMLQELVADALVTKIKNWRAYKGHVLKLLLDDPSIKKINLD